MFLTEVMLPRNIKDYEVHQYLHCFFDDGNRNFLFRRECDNILMTSRCRPKNDITKNLRRELFKAGNSYVFIGRFDITKKNIQSGRRIDIVEFQERRDWLVRKLTGIAEVKYCRVNHGNFISKGELKRYCADMSGVINIKDSLRFIEVLTTGLGRSKAFGCGLIYLPEIMR